jgi:DNA-binding NarL/FixJ family response regulator
MFMERKLTILLIEDEPLECMEIIRYSDTIEKTKIVAVTNSVNEAIEYTEDYLPDAVILDIELLKGSGNGFLFLERLRKCDIKAIPYVLVTTNNTSQITYDYLRELGADFIMSKRQKDYSAENVINFLCSMKGAIQNHARNQGVSKELLTTETPEEISNRIQKRINAELELVGISPKQLGKRYLIDAIFIIVQNGHSIRICTEVAKKHKKSEPSVERAMKNAINSAWNNADIEDLRNNYTARISSDKGVPTLTEFIYYYADKIKRDS